jgi:hypothetical protein
MTAWHDQYRSLTLLATRACTAAQQGIVANIGTSFGFMVLSLTAEGAGHDRAKTSPFGATRMSR